MWEAKGPTALQNFTAQHFSSEHLMVNIALQCYLQGKHEKHGTHM